MDYEINNETLIVFPVDEENSKVLEINATYEVGMSAYEVIEHSCEYFGSTLQGRQLGTKSLIGVTHKAPVFIEESTNIIFFPLNSPRNKNCMWVSFNNFLTCKPSVNARNSIIKFKNGEEIEVPASMGIVSNQVLRASRLQVVLNDRKQRIC